MSHICPNCGTVTDGTGIDNNVRVICPKCLIKGITVVMVEDNRSGTKPQHVGGGLFIKE